MKTYKLQRDPAAAPARKPRAQSAKPARQGLLSNEQKASICMLAQQAAERCGVTGWREVEAWRRDEQRKQWGLESLTAATQDQYPDIKAHFQALAGDLAGAYKTTRRGQDNPRRVARWHLNKALAAAKLSKAYAQAICKTQYRCTLDEATRDQLWRLVYTVKNRGNARKRKAAKSSGDPF